MAQKTEEARKKLQAEMDEKIKAVEKASEEERVNLQRELTRVKQEVVEIMKVKAETHPVLLAFHLTIQLQLNCSCKIHQYIRTLLQNFCYLINSIKINFRD